MKYVIINADDFGYSESINQGILEAARKGAITSTSVMVYGKAINDIFQLKDLPEISVGLHLHIEDAIPDAQDEFNKQIGLFMLLFGRAPGHIDIHKPRASNLGQLIPLLKVYAEKYHIPVRELGHIRCIKDFFGLDVKNGGKFDPTRITVDSLLQVFQSLDEGVSEIMCNVGYSDDELRKLSTYSDAREIELQSLTDSRVVDYLRNTNDIKLVSWNNVSVKT